MSISGMKDELYALERFYEHSSMDKPVDLVVALRKAIQDIEKYHEREARTKKPPVKSYCGGVPNYCTPEETPEVTGEVPCKTHPDAPHGFNRNASHNLDRYVCECEHWTPVDGVYMSQDRVDETAKGEHEPAAWVKLETWVSGETWPDDCFSHFENTDFVPLYLAPPKKEWVGLTDEEVAKYWGDAFAGNTQYVQKFARIIEAKLKEENT